jgi:hypothetical protein
MSDGGEFTVKVILMLLANVQLEVVAWNHEVSFGQNANGVVALVISCEQFLLNLLCTLSMSPLTVATYIPKDCRLLRSIRVVATESMVASRMMILYMRGVYSTPSNVYLFH